MSLRQKTKITIRGFTLIELLVVIAIIGLLSAVIIAPIQSSRKKARDAQRVSQMKAVDTALQLYFDDNGSYPIVSGWHGQCSGYGGYTNDQVIPGLVPNYIPRIPLDPLNTNNPGNDSQCYLYYSDGTQYKFLLHTPSESIPPPVAFYDPVRPTWAWQICEGATACSSW